MSSSKDKTAGVLAPVTSLRHAGDLGIGDVGGMLPLIDWAVEYGVGFLQLLPINETGDDHSPYNAISSVALEPSLIDLSAVPEIGADRVAEIRAGLDEEFLNGELVDYDQAKKLKRQLLEEGYTRFRGSDDFDAFCEAEKSWLDFYTKFRFLMDEEGGRETWDLWSINYRDADQAHAWIAAQAKAADRLRYHAWVQWVAFSQWRQLNQTAAQKGVKLMGDVPIGISYYLSLIHI